MDISSAILTSRASQTTSLSSQTSTCIRSSCTHLSHSSYPGVLPPDPILRGPPRRSLRSSATYLLTYLPLRPFDLSVLSAEAKKVGLRPDQVLVLPYGLSPLSPTQLAPHIPANSITTLISILTLCSVPSPSLTLGPFLSHYLAPGAQFLLYEHVLSETRADVRWWQRKWTPVWSWFFDGCRLDCDSMRVIKEAGGWKGEGKVWGKRGESDENLFGHVVGVFERE